MIDDLISRQKAIDLAKDLCVPTKDGSIYRHRCIDPDAIRELPSAQPEPKRGKWIRNNDSDHAWKCSVCGCGYTDCRLNYCYDCGAQMERSENDDLISRQAAIAYAIFGRTRTEDEEKWIRVQEVRESLLNMPSAQPEWKWIPVSEKLPEKHRPMIVTDFGHVTLAYTNNLGEWMDYDGNRLKNVTAWMPLPESYDEGEKIG